MNSAQSFLLACVPSGGDLSNLKRLCRQIEDWGLLYRLADRHQMVGIVAPILSKLRDGEPPDSAEAPWKQQWRALTLRDMTQWAALEQILLEAPRHGIRPILLKGLSL